MGTTGEQSAVVVELEKYRDEKANILIPTTKIDGLSEFHAVVIDSVTLSPNPADGDVYKKDGADGEFILTGQALQKLAVCAGVTWNPAETRPTCTSRDYVAYNAVGCIRKADGMQVCFQAEYDIDLQVVEDEIRDQHDAKAERWLKNEKGKWFQKMSQGQREAYLGKSIRKELNFKKKHKTKLAATGAKNRVIRALLAIKKSYTAAELQRPFVMPRVVVRPDYSDPEIKRMMMQAAIQSMTGVYGPPTQVVSEPPIDVTPEDVHVTEPDSDEPLPDDIPPAPDSQDLPEDDTQNLFKNADRKSQIQMIRTLANRKGFDLTVGKGIKKPLDDFEEKYLLQLWDKLTEMQDIDEIPY